MREVERHVAAPPTQRPLRDMLLVLFFCTLLFLPGQFSIPVVDRDEARFAQASRQMLESQSLEGWMVPRVQERLRLNKPPLTYWLQAASAGLLTGGSATRDAIWMYRLPSLLCAVATVLLTWALGRRLWGARAGLVAALLMAASPMLVWDAHQARSDQLLVCATTAAMLLLWLLWERRGAHAAGRLPAGLCALFWLLVGLGVMSKGPITPLIALLTAVTLAVVGRQWRWLLRLRPGLGVLLVAAVVAPWAVLVGESVGWGRYLAILSDEVLHRAASPKEGHAGPPGYHLLLLAVLFWPGSLVTVAAVSEAARGALRFQGTGEIGDGRLARLRRAWRGRGVGDGRLLFLLAWLVPAWIVFELVSTKLPHYTLPLYPALALLAGKLLTDRDLWCLPLQRLGVTVWLLIGLGFVGGLAGGLVFGLRGGAFNRGGDPLAAALPRFTDLEIGLSVLAVAGALLCLVVGGAAAWRGRLLRAQWWGLACSILVLAPTLGLVLPAAQALWLTPRLVAAVERLDPAAELPLAAVRYHEDSLIFASRGRVERLGRGKLAEWLAAHRAAIVIVPPEVVESHPDLTPHAALEGLNYSKGERVRLLVCTSGVRHIPEKDQPHAP